MNKKRSIAELAGQLAPRYFGKRLKNPVFIVGSGRSGTTMLTELLEMHQSIISYPNEANELWHPALYPYHKNTIDVPPIWIDPYKFSSESVKLWPTDWGLKIRAIFSAYQMLVNRPVFLNKTVMANFMLDKVIALFPEAKFIYIVRNGLSVALSYQKKEIEKYKFSRYDKYKNIIADEKKIRLQHAVYWNETVKQVEKDKKALFNKANFLELKYEDLVANPSEEVEKLLQFINLPMGTTKDFQAMINTINDRNYKALKELDDTERQSLGAAMTEGLFLKGYAN